MELVPQALCERREMELIHTKFGSTPSHTRTLNHTYELCAAYYLKGKSSVNVHIVFIIRYANMVHENTCVDIAHCVAELVVEEEKKGNTDLDPIHHMQTVQTNMNNENEKKK